MDVTHSNVREDGKLSRQDFEEGWITTVKQLLFADKISGSRCILNSSNNKETMQFNVTSMMT